MSTTPLDFGTQFQALIDASPSWVANIVSALSASMDGAPVAFAVAVAIMLGVAVAGERLICWKLNALERNMLEQQCSKRSTAFGYALMRMLFDLAGVAVFALFGWLALQFLANSESATSATLRAVLIAVVTVRAWAAVLRAVLAPATAPIRPVPLDDDDAQALYRWSFTFIAAYAGLVLWGEMLMNGAFPELLLRATVPLAGVLLNLTANLFVWRNRARLTRLFASSAKADAPPSALRTLLAQSWPFLVSAWLVLLWANWAYSIFIADAEREKTMLLSWWITLLFPIADRLINSLLRAVTGTRWLRDAGFESRRERFISVVLTCVRVIFAVVAVAATVITWELVGADLLQGDAAGRFITTLVDIGVIVLVAYVLYELVMAFIERNMPEDRGEEIEIEGEGGGAGATRAETIAPLLRGTFLVVLAVAVVLAVLSTVGVQVLPLIAGASIIGVAIGFGSQKLVQDVISGVFFLVDDAFRRGEYIDIGGIKGTVEKISVRSMQLRHHMGALHTIPFGEVRHLTNYSRDWVMMKLKLRLTYDTDIERVRKLIKKLGQQMLEDEEIGDKFLEPLKSQGVYSMEDDSAMIIRVKFMTRPGDQFVVRKTVYAKIRALFEAEGIEFAHRVVSVRIDGNGADELDDDDRRRVAGAALDVQPAAGSASR